MKDKNKKQDGREDRKASEHTGSTVQGGSNFGQGAAGLGKKSQQQGSESGKGANYENEQGWNNEALRSDDIE